MSGRTIAIGDIHGHTLALEAVLGAIGPTAEDTIVTLGDYVDRGPDSPGTIDRLISLGEKCRLIPILGNHDEMLLELVARRSALFSAWLSFGGDATLDAYGCKTPGEIPAAHVDFLKNCREWCEMERHFFVHASYLPNQPLDGLPSTVLRWESIRDEVPAAHYSGKTAIVGHTAQKNGRVLDLGYLKCIDTCVYGDGCLTAMDVDSCRIWQADKAGLLIEAQPD
jgi:serine/threonine protein phosphatase 1